MHPVVLETVFVTFRTFRIGGPYMGSRMGLPACGLKLQRKASKKGL